MQEIQKTRFIAANYTNLQGLRAVPMGLLLFVVVVWANSQTSPNRDLTIPFTVTAGLLLLAWWIRRFYKLHYGQVEHTARQKKFKNLTTILGAAAGISAFIIDTGMDLPFSSLGLVLSFALLADYGYLQRFDRVRYLLAQTLLFSAILLVVSLMPLFGFTGWWYWIGLRSQLYGVLAVAGAVILASGLLGHCIFVRQLPALED